MPWYKLTGVDIYLIQYQIPSKLFVIHFLLSILASTGINTRDEQKFTQRIRQMLTNESVGWNIEEILLQRKSRPEINN